MKMTWRRPCLWMISLSYSRNLALHVALYTHEMLQQITQNVAGHFTWPDEWNFTKFYMTFLSTIIYFTCQNPSVGTPQGFFSVTISSMIIVSDGTI